jgi:ABC-2 type transport system permease protein
MMHDVFTVVWKEWKELLQFQSGRRSGVAGSLIMLLVFGVVMPLQFEKMWVETPVSLVMWAFVPLILISTIIADSFAGERERHTLDTLLSSRLSDGAILLGKIVATVGYVWLITQLVFLVALIAVNVVHGQGNLLFYPLETLLGGMGLSFLLAGLMSSVGALVSLRAATVRQAQQTLGISVFLLAYVVPMAGIYAMRYLPEATRERLAQAFLAGDVTLIVTIACVGLVVLNVVMYLVASARFQRTKLLLD